MIIVARPIQNSMGIHELYVQVQGIYKRHSTMVTSLFQPMHNYLRYVQGIIVSVESVCSMNNTL